MNLIDIIEKAKEHQAEVVGVLRNRVILEKLDPVFENKPYVVTNVSTINGKVEFFSSKYDLTFDEAALIMTK